MPPAHTDLVSLEFRRWSQFRQQRTPHAGARGKVIALSATYGSQGDTVARRAAELLGFTYWDRDIVRDIAKAAKVDRTLVDAVEAYQFQAVSELLGLFSTKKELPGAAYLQRLAEVIALIAANGEAVIMGRAANELLGPARALRVHVDAPLPLRVQRFAERERVEEPEARSRVLAEDARRERWLREMTGKAPTDFSGYDLVLSTQTLTIEQAAAVVAAAWRATNPAP
ncbi:MAG: cytidylate kinase-like family protein [Pseudomonadota bacterium]